MFDSQILNRFWDWFLEGTLYCCAARCECLLLWMASSQVLCVVKVFYFRVSLDNMNFLFLCHRSWKIYLELRRVFWYFLRSHLWCHLSCLWVNFLVQWKHLTLRNPHPMFKLLMSKYRVFLNLRNLFLFLFIRLTLDLWLRLHHWNTLRYHIKRILKSIISFRISMIVIRRSAYWEPRRLFLLVLVWERKSHEAFWCFYFN